MRILNQSIKRPLWVGAIQVQISNTMFYMNMVSMGMMLLTFWYTAGYQIQQASLHWLTLGWFVLFIVLLFGLVMLIDYKWIYPARQAFYNEQACKHNNPWMDEIIKLEGDMKKIKAKLGIEE
jgi:hypothetical protein